MLDASLDRNGGRFFRFSPQFWLTCTCGLKTRLSSSQLKGEKVFHRGILDHANFLDVEGQRERQPQTNLYDLRDEGARASS